MTDPNDIQRWPAKIRQRYENYLKTSFYFKDPALRESFPVPRCGKKVPC